MLPALAPDVAVSLESRPADASQDGIETKVDPSKVQMPPISLEWSVGKRDKSAALVMKCSQIGMFYQFGVCFFGVPAPCVTKSTESVMHKSYDLIWSNHRLRAPTLHPGTQHMLHKE